MTVTVVPILRLRRATRGWSYKVPAGVTLQAGALVIVPFRGHATLGVVWDLEESSKATAVVEEILTTTPLVRAPHRELIEWLAEEGLCSLSTALYVWLPASLRSFPLTKPVRAHLASWDTNQPSAQELALSKQHAVLVPNHRDAAEKSLSEKYGLGFRSTFADTTAAQEFETWIEIAQGRVAVATGRERVLYAPWVNLRHITVIEPEDISYHTGQTPYLNLVDGARTLAGATRAEPTFRTNVPLKAAELVWPESAGLPCSPPSVELTDLRHARLINDSLVEQVKHCIDHDQHVILLYNAHDRWKLQPDGSRIVIPGMETIGRQLTTALGLSQPSPLVHLGTRSILADIPRPVGLTVVLSLDPLLTQSGIQDQLHGWGDLGRLCQLHAPLIVQTHDCAHPLAQALQNDSFETYCLHILRDAQQAGVPPFSEEIVCATASDASSEPTPAELALQLQQVMQIPWQVGHPRNALRRGKPVTIITLNAPKHSRVTKQARTLLAALPRPWKVERGPWYAA